MKYNLNEEKVIIKASELYSFKTGWSMIDSIIYPICVELKKLKYNDAAQWALLFVFIEITNIINFDFEALITLIWYEYIRISKRENEKKRERKI